MDCRKHQIRMFVHIWATLLFSVRNSNADTGASVRERQVCQGPYCITLTDGAITAEAGLCVVIPCSFTTYYWFTPQHIVWYKCEPTKQKCGDSDVIFHTKKNNRKVQPGFTGRVSLLEPDVTLKNCSIIINDLKESDSGLYQLGVNGVVSGQADGFTYAQRATVSVHGLSQKPTLMIPPLTAGQQATLTCTAPGLCSGSDPKITWTWRGAGEMDSHITGLITANQEHTSTLTFKLTAEHHSMEVTCEVSFTGNTTTEETVVLNVTYVQHHGPSTVLPWAVAGASLSVNVLCIIFIVFLWYARKTLKPNQEDRTYMSLQKTDRSPEYDVIARPRN
ncbi:sialic acid-binding Ig-like lectin 14 isoform X2 [Xiphias gladius]|uniref:sialic acid-binding Ig-like lectin 14 isoform X2 n=1 Tax=Xiphias gladius TaxID=8245 RepID=UPI001A97F8DE|nr:sialic acid-binding Ig-like lectin 14 isoform X2 [Xiphias gladius]